LLSRVTVPNRRRLCDCDGDDNGDVPATEDTERAQRTERRRTAGRIVDRTNRNSGRARWVWPTLSRLKRESTVITFTWIHQAVATKHELFLLLLLLLH
jgi:hypothetical protein